MNKTTSSIEFPFRVESETEIHTDSVAGQYGTVVEIIERECPFCGYDRARVFHALLPDVYGIDCMACGEWLERDGDVRTP